MASGTLVPAAKKVIPIIVSGIFSVYPIKVTCETIWFRFLNEQAVRLKINTDDVNCDARTIQTMMYEKMAIQRTELMKVTRNHFVHLSLLQSGIV